MKKIVILILIVATGVLGYQVTKDNLLKGSSGEAGLSKSSPTAPPPTAVPSPSFPTTLGNFLITDREVCKENGKPSVYFFGLSTCPHCVWEKPIAKKVFDLFKDEIVYHENFDSQKDNDVMQKYTDINQGYVPFLILGCKYARVGAGENLGATAEESTKLEEEALTAILCKLTNGKPSSVCASVKDKTLEVK